NGPVAARVCTTGAETARRCAGAYSRCLGGVDGLFGRHNVQTELSGRTQATDPNAMPLADYVAEVMQMLGDPIPANGEILADRAKALRWAEKNSEYEQMFAARNKQ